MSQTAASNYPAGSDSPATLDDTIRAHGAFIAQLNVAANVPNATAKATAVDADLFPINDSAASNILKKLTFANLKASLKTYFDTLYGAIGTYAASGANADITSLTALTSAIAEVRQIQPISASVASSALTISASDLSLEFRSATLTSGAVSFVKGTPSNLVISSGSTLGTVSAVPSRIVVLALNNAGTIELAAVNIAGGVDLSETGLISTTAEGGAGAADSASVVYSTTARTNVAYRVIGYIESTQATAGTWASAPSLVQGQGGQAMAAMQSLGWGQTWQDVSGSRARGTTYYNTTGKPIVVHVWGIVSAGSSFFRITVNGVAIISGTSTITNAISAVVPPLASYVVQIDSGTPTIQGWVELR